jgi:hypothetical protein
LNVKCALGTLSVRGIRIQMPPTRRKSGNSREPV